jgi:hypothetical protein
LQLLLQKKTGASSPEEDAPKALQTCVRLADRICVGLAKWLAKGRRNRFGSKLK